MSKSAGHFGAACVNNRRMAKAPQPEICERIGKLGTEKGVRTWEKKAFKFIKGNYPF